MKPFKVEPAQLVELAIALSQLAVAAVVAWQVFAPADTPLRAAAWRATAAGARKVAYQSGRLAIAAEAAYHRAVAPYG